jgi:hypothetical protein
MQATEQFSFYSNNETSAQTILNGLTHLFDPLPPSNLERFTEVLQRIGFVAYEPIPIKFLLAFEIIFSLGARTGSENKRAILSHIALLFLRAPRGKELEIESKILSG